MSKKWLTIVAVTAVAFTAGMVLLPQAVRGADCSGSGWGFLLGMIMLVCSAGAILLALVIWLALRAAWLALRAASRSTRSPENS